MTRVSGRGVGMDVARTNIEKIGGTIELKSVEGQGSPFTIKIPLRLAVISALLVEWGGERVAIPQISVRELVRASAKVENGLLDTRDATDATRSTRSTAHSHVDSCTGLPGTDISI